MVQPRMGQPLGFYWLAPLDDGAGLVHVAHYGAVLGNPPLVEDVRDVAARLEHRLAAGVVVTCTMYLSELVGCKPLSDANPDLMRGLRWQQWGLTELRPTTPAFAGHPDAAADYWIVG